MGCSDSGTVDSLFGESDGPAQTIPEFIDVPISLSLAVSSPEVNSNVGYEVRVTGTCNTPGTVVEYSGAAEGFGICNVSNTWESVIDLSGVPIGAVSLDFELVQGDTRSSSVNLTLNKPSDACDDPLARAATFASAVSPYEICTITQLENISTLIVGGIVSDDFILRNTLDFNGGSWNPINARLTGTFDGNGLSLENAIINQASTDDIGLFKRAGGTFANLNIRGFIVNGRNSVGILAGVSEGGGNTLQVSNVNIYDSEVNGNNYVGGVVGWVDPSVSLDVDDVEVSNIQIVAATQGGGILGGTNGSATNVTIDNTHVTGTVTGNQYIGGVIGMVDHTSTTLTDVSYVGDVTGSINRIGGLIGRTDGATINNSHVIGNIVSIYDGGNEAYVGGLVGYSEDLSLFTCYHNGNISGLSSHIGGLVGRLNGTGTIHDSYSTLGTITGNSALRATNHVGGLVGHASSTSDIQRSYSTKNITTTGVVASSNMGGLVGYVRGLNLVDSYNTGVLSFTNGDGLTTGGGYYGGLIGYINPNTANPTVTISQSNNSGAITVNVANRDVRTGGVVGGIAFDNAGLQTVNISDVANTADVTSTNRFTGGIIGWSRQHRNGDTLSLNNLTSSGTIRVTQFGNISDDAYVGGIAGYLEQEGNTPSTGNVSVTNLSSTATLDLTGYGAGGNYVGGIVGRMILRRDSIATVSNWNFTGGAVYSPRGYVGGLAGNIDGANDAVLNLTNFTVSIPSVSSGANQGYVGGAFGRLSVANDAIFNVDTIVVNVPTVDVGHQRAGGFAGDIYAANDSSMDIDDITVNVTTVTNNSGQNYTGGFVGRIEARNNTSMAMDNIVVNTTTVSGTGGRIGGFAGSVSGNTVGTHIYQDIHANATVTSTATSGYAGGLAGEMTTGVEFDRCSSTGDVTIAGGGYAGGLFGGAGGTSRRISNCFATGDVSAAGGSYVGGLVGRMYGTIENSYATGDASGVANNVGGLVGEMRETTIRNSFATGDVSGVRYIGGLAGYIYNPVTVVNAFSAGNVVGERQVGGFMGVFRGDAGDVDSIYTLGTVTRSAGTQNSFGEICGDCDNDGDVVNSFYNSDTVAILGGVASPEVQGNAGRNATTANLQNPAFYPPSWDFVGATVDDWRFAVTFTLPGAGAVYPYPVPYWLEN